MSELPRWTMSHIGLYVTDIEAMAAFYTGVLGFQVTDRGPFGDAELLFLSRNATDHHQIVLIPGRPAGSYNVVNQISLKVDTVQDLRRYHEHLTERSVDDIDPVDHGNAWSVYFRDPEGNRLEVFMDTAYYVVQPQREELDFSLDDAGLDRVTQERFGGDPSFCRVESWRQSTFRAAAAE